MIRRRHSRQCITATTVLAGLAVGLARPAAAEDNEFRAKKDQELDAKTSGARSLSTADRAKWHEHLDARIGTNPTPVVNIHNLWTHETVVIDKHADSTMPAPAFNSFLRCHFTNEPTTIDRRLFGVLARAAVHFDVDRVNVVSGFRAPKYNLILRKKGRQVARNSQHPLGHAVNFRLPGVPTERLRRWALTLKLGGVGYYPSSGFVHVNTGPIRQWRGN